MSRSIFRAIWEGPSSHGRSRQAASAPVTETVTKQRRSVGGKIIAALFWTFQVLMAAIVVILICLGVSDGGGLGAMVAASFFITSFLMLWLLGTAILGVMMAFTRGKTVTIVREQAQ